MPAAVRLGLPVIWTLPNVARDQSLGDTSLME
jgi:hypothetical protein